MARRLWFQYQRRKKSLEDNPYNLLCTSLTGFYVCLNTNPDLFVFNENQSSIGDDIDNFKFDINLKNLKYRWVFEDIVKYFDGDTFYNGKYRSEYISMLRNFTQHSNVLSESKSMFINKSKEDLSESLQYSCNRFSTGIYSIDASLKHLLKYKRVLAEEKLMETVAEIEPEDGQEFNQLRRVEYELIDDRYQTNLFIV